MKFLAASALALAATTIAAPVEQVEERNDIEARKETQSAPFYLKVVGKAENPSIDGYLAAYHAGAAIQAMGYVTELPKGDKESYQWYLNTTTNGGKVGGSAVGDLIWKLPYNGDQSTDTVMSLTYQPGTNIAQCITEPSSGGYGQIGFSSKNQMFTPIYYDDSENKPTEYPQPQNPTQGQNWVLCWQYYGSYYYRSLAWATSFPTTNPTCRPVTVTKVAV